MSFGVTFGSIGDLIAVGQVVFSLMRALRDSRGSVKEYQDLLKELQLFDKTLFQATLLLQSHETSPEIMALCAVANEIARDSQVMLNAFREKVDRKYGSTLGVQNSPTKFKAAAKKIGWIREKEEIAELKAKLQASINSIALLIAAAVGKSNMLNNKKQGLKMQAIHDLLQDSLLRAEDYRLGMQAEQRGHANLVLNKVTQVNIAVTEIKGMLERFQGITDSLHSVPTGFGGTWKQAPVTLEDALGKIVPIPLELVDSWDMLHTILYKRFVTHGYPGQTKALKREYIIGDGQICMKVPRNRIAWTAAFRPGQKVNMSMIFPEIATTETSCPKCKMAVSAPMDTPVECANPVCKMLFRRFIPLDDNEDEEAHDDLQTFWLNKTLTQDSKEIEDTTPADFRRVSLMSVSVSRRHILTANEKRSLSITTYDEQTWR